MRYTKSIFFVVLILLLMIGSRTKEIKLTEGIQPGNLAPEIHWQDINLKSNHFTVLQFWAAYDAYSRMLNARMHNVISQLDTEDIRLISVSFDENEAVFDGIVKVDRLNRSTQFNDPKGKTSGIFKSYRLKSGFSNFLINPEGVIVAKNVNPNDIRRHVERSETSENY